MKKARGIAELKDYGKVDIVLNSIMDKYDISIYRMSQLTGLKHSTIKAYYTNCPITRVDLDVLSKMCYVLDCSVGDILKYHNPDN